MDIQPAKAHAARNRQRVGLIWFQPHIVDPGSVGAAQIKKQNFIISHSNGSVLPGNALFNPAIVAEIKLRPIPNLGVCSTNHDGLAPGQWHYLFTAVVQYQKMSALILLTVTMPSGIQQR
jgi:hypothetical protein